MEIVLVVRPSLDINPWRSATREVFIPACILYSAHCFLSTFSVFIVFDSVLQFLSHGPLVTAIWIQVS
jgi:hypothetical protein